MMNPNPASVFHRPRLKCQDFGNFLFSRFSQFKNLLTARTPKNINKQIVKFRTELIDLMVISDASPKQPWEDEKEKLGVEIEFFKIKFD